jgi:hypothetical protein
MEMTPFDSMNLVKPGGTTVLLTGSKSFAIDPSRARTVSSVYDRPGFAERQLTVIKPRTFDP